VDQKEIYSSHMRMLGCVAFAANPCLNCAYFWVIDLHKMLKSYSIFKLNKHFKEC